MMIYLFSRASCEVRLNQSGCRVRVSACGNFFPNNPRIAAAVLLAGAVLLAVLLACGRIISRHASQCWTLLFYSCSGHLTGLILGFLFYLFALLF